MFSCRSCSSEKGDLYSKIKKCLKRYNPEQSGVGMTFLIQLSKRQFRPLANRTPLKTSSIIYTLVACAQRIHTDEYYLFDVTKFFGYATDLLYTTGNDTLPARSLNQYVAYPGQCKYVLDLATLCTWSWWDMPTASYSRPSIRVDLQSNVSCDNVVRALGIAHQL